MLSNDNCCHHSKRMCYRLWLVPPASSAGLAHTGTLWMWHVLPYCHIFTVITKLRVKPVSNGSGYIAVTEACLGWGPEMLDSQPV